MSIETPEQLEGLRRAGAVVAEVLRTLEAAVQPGVTTGVLDVDRDGWTVRTRDHSRSAHEEHTVVVGPDGAQVLTAA